MSSDILFSGKITTYGFLFPTAIISNTEELVRACPAELREENNPWFCLVLNILKFGFFNELFNDDNFKTSDRDIKDKQIWYLSALYKTLGIKAEDQVALMGWMLSEMLVNVPKYPERKKKDFQDIEKFMHGYQDSGPSI